MLPYQSAELERYFSQFYFVYTLGIMSSKIISPEIRAQTRCFGKTECYPAVYGALGTIFLTSWSMYGRCQFSFLHSIVLIALTRIFVSAVVFLVGIPLYRRETINREDGSMILRFIDCIWYGIKRRLRGCTIANLTDSPWIDGSVEKYPESFVREVSAFMKLLKLCIPLTLYWTLFTQIDSNWTFQASQLNTNVLGVKFEADQVNSYSNAYSTKCATQIINFDCVSLVGQRSRCIAFIAHDSFLEICMRTVAGQVRCGIVAAEIDGFGRTVCHAIVCMCRSVTA